MIEVTNLKKQFKSGEHTVTALNDVNFKVEEGVFAAIIGKSGAGKSTLLAQLGALDSPTSGKIVVGDKEVTGLSAHQLTKYRRQLIGFVFQQYNLVPNLTALENVMLPMEFNGVLAPLRRKQAKELLEKVGLDAVKQSRKPARLSGGEQQRVAIARALANKPKLILADEPTGNLDEQTGKAIFDLLHELTRSHKTTIIAVTHDLSIAGRTDQTFRLSDGKLAPVKSGKN